MKVSLFGAALVLSVAGGGACSSNSSGPPGPTTDDGGPDATATDGATEATDGASPGTDAASDAAHDSASPADAGTDGASLDGSGDASDASTPAYALFVGTDYVNTELSAVALNPDSVAGHLSLADTDSVPYASGGVGFVMEQTLGQVIALNPAKPWTAQATIDVNDTADAGPFGSNPYAVVVTAGTKAYVARYSLNTLDIVDVATGSVTGKVDLSSFVVAGGDGLIDVADGAYDPTSNRAYFVLQRINQGDYSGSAPDYVGACLPIPAAIVAIDATTDAVVPLSDAGGGATELLGADPASITPDFANGRLIIADQGCYAYPDGGADGGDTIRLGRGIESVSVANATSTWLYQTDELERLSGVIWVSDTQAYVNEGSDWYSWNPTQTTLGAAVTGFPQAPFYDGTGRIVGLSYTTNSDGGVTWSVVAWSIASSELSTIAAAPFQSVVPATSYGVGSALLR